MGLFLSGGLRDKALAVRLLLLGEPADLRDLSDVSIGGGNPLLSPRPNVLTRCSWVRSMSMWSGSLAGGIVSPVRGLIGLSARAGL
ncbi:hypothetical protein HGG76_11945 [Ochrobactrum tritici]|uniref:Uncharacterized protein n=1 Tax=Brucella tritici TaxID=94626 RepID=A0A7X6FSV9_9HYPH|nr:hypothetical protein [Brucella tritici]